ncbi:MAG: hypothetical protein ACRD1O_11685, partial [Terriglobia bacterium]
MAEGKAVRWHVPRFARFKRATGQVGRSVRARYWFPHVPLSLALTIAGLLLLWIIFTLQRRVLLSDLPESILNFRPSSMPYVLIGVAMLIMSVGLLFRSRFAWIVALVLTACTILSAVIIGHSHHLLLVYYDGILLVL